MYDLIELNKDDLSDIDKVPNLTININKWIYAELIEAKSKIEKNLADYRFDEAAKNAYQFAWHSYCDWYLELSKTILFSDNDEAKSEVKKVSSYIFKQILILLHPFIPFVTEEIWLKNKFDNSSKTFLMLANWPTGKINKDTSTEQVENIISIISEIRSFKNELNVGPGSFIDMSINNINDKQKKFINDNDMAGDGSQDEIIFYHEADKLFIVRHPSINYYGIDQIYEWNKCRRDELNFE